MAKRRSPRSETGRGAESGRTTGQDQEQGAGVVEQAKDKAQELASQAQEKAGEQVESGLAKGKSRAAETLGGVAQSLRLSSQHLRDQNQEGTGRYVEKAAQQVERLSSYLQNRDVGEVIDEVEDFARRQPALFLGGAFALGLLGARFLKSSRRGQAETAGSEYLAYRGAGAQTRPAYGAYAGERDVTGMRQAAGLVPQLDLAAPEPGLGTPSEPPGYAPPGAGTVGVDEL
jgi:hypothetical protein